MSHTNAKDNAALMGMNVAGKMQRCGTSAPSAQHVLCPAESASLFLVLPRRVPLKTWRIKLAIPSLDNTVPQKSRTQICVAASKRLRWHVYSRLRRTKSPNTPEMID